MAPLSRYELVYGGKVPWETLRKGMLKPPLRTVASFPADSLMVDRSWANQLIFGDNLPLLNTLVEELGGKVRLVYIDPPFSTERRFHSGTDRASTISYSRKDSVAYDDTLSGPEFLEFLRQRLLFLRELLAEDGSIYVHIGCNRAHYLKVLMDEVFGEDRFVNEITRIKCNPKNFTRRAFGNIKDTMLFYTKTESYCWNDSRLPFTTDDLNRLFPKTDKDGRRYTTVPLHAPGETANGVTGGLWKSMMPPKGRHWRTHPDELTRLDEEGLIEWSSNNNPRRRIYADDIAVKGKKRQDVWEFKDPAYPSYPTEKNLDLLKAIIRASSNEGDLVLDCFAGAGTTLVAAEELGRRWLGVDNSTTAIVRSMERLLSVKRIRPFNLCVADGESLPNAIKKALKKQCADKTSSVAL